MARLITAGAVLLIAACGGSGLTAAPASTTAVSPRLTTIVPTLPTTSTTAVAGAPDLATLTEMVGGLCETKAELAAGRSVAARSLFYARSHDTIHLLMDAVGSSEPELVGELEEAKNELEVRFGYLFQDDDVAAEMDRLLATLTPVLAVAGGPTLDC